MSTKPSIFEEATLQSATDATRTIDIKAGILTIDYFESVLTPTVSMRISVVDSGSSIEDPQTGKPTTVYQGLPVTGKEKFFVRVRENSANNVALDFVSRPLIVRGCNNASIGSKKQLFTLDLVSSAGVNNEISFVNKNWTDTRINTIVKEIMENQLQYSSTEYAIDETANSIGFGGNQMKPFKALTMLAKKSIPVTSMNTSAGYFFYETKDGLRFCGIDNLIRKPPKAEYFYSEVNVNEADFVPTPNLPSLDRKILQYTIIKNEDVVGSLKTGTYATSRRFFDPANFLVSRPDQGYFGPELYSQFGKIASLGGKALSAEIFNSIDRKDTSSDLIAESFNKPSKILTEVISKGVYDKNVTQRTDEDIFGFTSQSLTRYNSLFKQCISILVPLNSKLCAGDIVKINIPLTTDGTGDRNDDQISGDYMIKELCHHYEADGSFTKMKIVRDTSGVRKSEN